MKYTIYIITHNADHHTIAVLSRNGKRQLVRSKRATSLGASFSKIAVAYTSGEAIVKYVTAEEFKRIIA